MCRLRRIPAIVCISVALFAFMAAGDDYDGIMQTHNTTVSAQMASEAIRDSRLCSGTVSNLYGVWAAPDGGKWYFESNGLMGDAGRHRGMTYTLQDNQISFYGTSGYEQYELYFTTDYDQVFLFDADLSNCVLALNRLTQLMGGTNNLSGMTQDIPRGALDEIGVGPGVVFVAGWTYDPNATQMQSQYYVCIGGSYGVGETFGPFEANLIRDDVNNSHGVGRYHGYGTTVYTERNGYQDIYVYTTDYPSGQLVLMGSGAAVVPEKAVDSGTAQELPDTGNGYLPGTQNEYSSEQAASIMHKYCESRTSSNGISYILDEYLEDSSTYVVWWRSYTGFTTQYRVDLTNGDVIQSGPYNGKTPDEQLPFSKGYAFNLSEYVD